MEIEPNDNKNDAEAVVKVEEEEEEDGGGDDDELSGLQNYTPSVLLSLGQFELRFFNNIYTQTKFWDGDGNTIDQGNRASYYAMIGSFVYGINPRINIGLDFWVRSVRIDDTESSPFNILKFSNQPGSRTAISNIGPKVKFIPFSRLTNLSVQSTFLVPLPSDPEGKMNGRPFLDFEDFLWWTQIFFDKYIVPSKKLQFFAELDFFTRIDRKLDFSETGGTTLGTPVSTFLSYFPNPKLTLYGMGQFWPTYGEGFINNYYFQSGLGGKYQIVKGFEVEVLYSRFLFGKATAGPGTTMNLGLRFVRL